ncbi:MAG: HEAT repeat domain-containing protein [Anaerolineae bacterium]|nr:HEAT repeat domain-containing protein [Anaerolineae bacterium]
MPRPSDLPAIEVLVEILEKGDWMMRFRAASVLLDLGDRRGRDFIAEALENRKKDIRGAAIEILAEHGGTETVDLLRIPLKDKDQDIRLLAAETLLPLINNTKIEDADFLAEIQAILREDPSRRPPAPPEVEKSLDQMELGFGILGMIATILALAMLVLGKLNFALPFIVLCISAIAAFTGNRGVERRDRKGYYLALAGSLFLLPGVPLFTIPGLIFLFRLLKQEFMQAFGIAVVQDEQEQQ